MKIKTTFAKMTACSLMLTALFGCGQASQTADGAQDSQSPKSTSRSTSARSFTSATGYCSS